MLINSFSKCTLKKTDYIYLFNFYFRINNVIVDNIIALSAILLTMNTSTILSGGVEPSSNDGISPSPSSSLLILFASSLF